MQLNFLVIGDICVDRFVYGHSKRLSPEAPVPVFTPTETKENGGMAENVYNNLRSLIIADKENHCVDSIFSESTANKIRYVDTKTNHYFLRVDEDKNIPKFELSEDNRNKIRKADCIIISDYDKGFLTISDIELIFMSKKREAKIFLDTKKDIPEQLFRVVNYLNLNEKEYNSISEINRINYQHKIIATLGENGACHNRVYFQVKSPKNTIDVSGAGDTFMAALCYHYMMSDNMGQSIIFANEKASEVVSKRGVAIV